MVIKDRPCCLIMCVFDHQEVAQILCSACCRVVLLLCLACSASCIYSECKLCVMRSSVRPATPALCKTSISSSETMSSVWTLLELLGGRVYGVFLCTWNSKMNTSRLLLLQIRLSHAAKEFMQLLFQTRRHQMNEPLRPPSRALVGGWRPHCCSLHPRILPVGCYIPQFQAELCFICFLT